MRKIDLFFLFLICFGLFSCGGGYDGPVHFIISGQVTLNGEGYEGATVTLTDDLNGDWLVDATITDEHGGYAFTGLPNGTYTVTVLVVGQNVAPASIPGIVIARDDSSGHDFALVTHTVSGGVTLEGKGYPGVLVALSGDAESFTTTDLSGVYLFPGLLNGDYTVAPLSSVDTFDPAFKYVKVTSEDEILDEFVVVLPDTYIISGTVALNNGADSEWVTITLTNGSAEAFSTRPDASGYYSFANLLPGTYTVTPSSEFGIFDEEPWTGTISDSDIPDVNFTFNPYLYSISGTVNLTVGDPVEITITLTEEGVPVDTVTPQESGAYAFPGRLPGTYTVTPSSEAGTFDPPDRQVTIINTDFSNVDFDFTPYLTGLTITGSVSVNESSTANYTATASWDDGTTTDVTASATWSEDSSYATIDGGVLATDSVETDQGVNITAEFAHEGVTQSDTFAVTILDIM